jgi:ribosomal protein S18 acetylase RimI-like enzyme
VDVDAIPLEIVESPDRADVERLDERLHEFNVEATGLADGRLLSIFVRDAAGELEAGVYGWTWGGCCYIRTLWIGERLRRRGLGTRLMRRVEEEARARGAFQILLETHSFQAPGFYRRLGFEAVGEVDDYPRGHRNVFMRKRLPFGDRSP